MAAGRSFGIPEPQKRAGICKYHAMTFLRALGLRYRSKNFLSGSWGALQDLAMKNIKWKKPGTHQFLVGARLLQSTDWYVSLAFSIEEVHLALL